MSPHMSELVYNVEHIGLAARDTVALKDWYVRALGARQVFKNTEEPPAFLLELPGGTLIEIYPAHSTSNRTNDNRLAGWRHLALRVASIAATKVELEARGVIFTEPVKPAGGGGLVQFFPDGEGNLLHLVERTPGSLFNP
jgi:glyoxylase I family protein